MCQPASFVLTKTACYWSMKTDSHTEIIVEHKLHEDGVRGVNVVKVEITPTDNRFDSDPVTWRYRLDQDQTPDWYDATECERRARVELAKWVDARVLKTGEHVVCDGVYLACGDAAIIAKDSSTVWAYDSSTVTAYDSSTVRACDSSTVRAYDSSTVRACEDHATVRHYDHSEPVAPTGNFAVVIDCRGNSAAVRVAEPATV